eukprot:TRINITY_DN18522_c0_g2_i2.p1 TRINITY_DN18522_c0_g2~~TRINITY_DN18522_c0_g2_i2.p1  ORF type:complete len:319 (+),score=70.12 TRINITY_DN18522_c0_g2_i2:98-1054(+)
MRPSPGGPQLGGMVASMLEEVACLERLAIEGTLSTPTTDPPPRDRKLAWAPPALAVEVAEKDEEGDEDAALAVATIQALLHDREAMRCDLRNFDYALSVMLEQLTALRGQAARLGGAKAHVAELRARLSREAAAREALLRENARLFARISELASVASEALDAEGDVHREALVDALALENRALHRMVRISQAASSAVIPNALEALKLPSTPSPQKSCHEARRHRRSMSSQGSSSSETSPAPLLAAPPSSPAPLPMEKLADQEEACAPSCELPTNSEGTDAPLPEPEAALEAFDITVFRDMAPSRSPEDDEAITSLLCTW